MSNEILDEIFNGTPELNEEKRIEASLDNREAVLTIESLQDEQEQPVVTPESPQQQPTSKEVKPETKEDPENVAEGFAKSFSEESADLRNPLNWSNVPAAAGAGLVDFGVDVVNLLPFSNIPKLPKYESDTLQAIRNMSGLIIPMILGSKGAKSLGAKAHKKVGWKIGNDPLVKFLSKAGIDAGVGATVDSIAEIQEKDDNLQGFLKKSWPNTYQFIPDDWATLDEDSPDIKRVKNRNEGIGLGLFADVLLGAGKLFKSLKKTKQATQWIPENELAKNVLKDDGVKLSDDPLEDAVLKSAKRRSDNLTELGQANLSKVDGEPTEPILGVHDVFDHTETGVRTADDKGIYGAAVDAKRIEDNIDTVNGRVGSVFTDAALKQGLGLNDAGIKTMKALGDQLKKTEFGWKASNGRYISHKEIVDTGERLAADLYEMDVFEMRKALKQFSGKDVDTGATVLSSEGYAGVFSAIKKYFDDYMNLDTGRAQAYVATSLSGQVSDIAEGARLMEGTAAMEYAEGQILDRLQYLMQMKGTTSYVRGRALNMLNLWKRAQKIQDLPIPGKKKLFANMVAHIEGEVQLTKEQLAKIADEAANSMETLRAVKQQKPEMLEPLKLAYEVTDGKVDSITKLNEYIKNTTGVFSKAFFDGRTDMPSAWTQGMWSNIYNSVLSSIGTPLKAGLSNLALMVERPIATFAGALANGDRETLRRGSYMYFVGMGDTLQKAYSHMNQVFRRASSDPTSVSYIMRDDIARKNEDTIEALRAFADAKSTEGLDGPTAMLHQIEAMNDLGEHPVLRFSANAMSAFDGFTRSFIGSIEARGRAYDQLKALGQPVTEKELKSLSKGLYDEMFDDTGAITDKAIEYASREIAMNLDNPAIDSLSALLQKAPAFKPFLMFPRTSLNMLQFAGSHNPLGLFTDQLNKFQLPFNQMAYDDVDRLLKERSVDFTPDNAEAIYNTIRAELKGRKAIGTLTVMGAATMFAGDRLHGNGIFDKQRQKVRRELGWKPRSYKGWDGNWYSYEGLGPLTDWLSLTADIMDNFDTLDDPTIELMLNKAGFILSANITNKSFTAGLEPLNDVLAGNPAALSRWAASFGNSFAPLSGFRNEFARLLSPQIKEMEQDILQLSANRNPIAKGGLPSAYDWIDGTPVGEPTSFFTRIWNTYSPAWKVSEAITPEKQFLIDIEFDGRPSLNTNGKGIEYTPEQRSQVTELIGKDKIFKNAIQRIMKGTNGQAFRNAYKKAQKTGAPIDRTLYANLHRELNEALRGAQRYAESRIEEANEVAEKQYLQNQVDAATLSGDIEELERLQTMYR